MDGAVREKGSNKSCFTCGGPLELLAYNYDIEFLFRCRSCGGGWFATITDNDDGSHNYCIQCADPDVEGEDGND